MKVHPDELESARAYVQGLGFEELTPEQTRLIMERGRSLHRWFKTHPRTHALINTVVIAAIFAADWWVVTQLPRLLLSPGASDSAVWIVLAAAIVGAIHSWLGYSQSIFSLHEGAAHNLIFPGTGVFSRIGQFVSRNMCRLANAEPNQYADCHMSHHAKFGTEDDAEFLNFVRPRRLWLILLPYGVFFNFSDFVIHRPLTYTRGRILSSVCAFLYNGVYAWFAYRHFGALFTIVAFVIVFPHVGFWTDRVRQFTEHNLMPLSNKNGSRSFGVGFWGLLVGGGPWGQPCHLVHHIVPSIPWYQQMALHRYLASILTDRQRAQFMVTPIIGYPRLVWTLIRDLNAAAKGGRHAGQSIVG
jgi:Fatty acid desaturase